MDRFEQALAARMPNYPPMPIGSPVYFGREKWTIGAVGVTGGERYYWLTDADGGVAMLPACSVEPFCVPAKEG